MSDKKPLKLTLNRKEFTEESTIGELLIDDKFQCYTLEDRVRPKGVKVFGKTAIPAGMYEVTITYSNRFKHWLPLLLNVPKFEGIRIHSGNKAVHTEGCILVGKRKMPNIIYDSRLAMDELYSILHAAFKEGRKISIQIAEQRQQKKAAK